MNDFGGIDPPAVSINPDYKQQPGNSRKCIECGKMHDTIVEDTRTGERLREIDKCKDCLIFGTVIEPKYKVALGRHDFPINYISTKYPGGYGCMTSDGGNVNEEKGSKSVESTSKKLDATKTIEGEQMKAYVETIILILFCAGSMCIVGIILEIARPLIHNLFK